MAFILLLFIYIKEEVEVVEDSQSEEDADAPTVRKDSSSDGGEPQPKKSRWV